MSVIYGFIPEKKNKVAKAFRTRLSLFHDSEINVILRCAEVCGGKIKSERVLKSHIIENINLAICE